MNLPELERDFVRHYGASQEKIHAFFAPGRVNLIGDHIDYNGGSVLPVTLTMGITLLIRKREDQELHFHSSKSEKDHVWNLADPEWNYQPDKDWSNYPAGVIELLRKGQIEVTGADLFYSSNLPIGAGLSSSAVMEVVTGFALIKLTGVEPHLKSLSLLCQEAENTFVGMNCGIMDQFAVAHGQENQAILLDTRNLEHEMIPANFGPFKIIIVNSKVEHQHSTSGYNTRRIESTQALIELRKQQPDLEYLCDATFSQVEEGLEDLTLQARARHAVWENQYVLEAVEALKDGDLLDLGESFDASHLSLSNDYEVSTPEVDMLVDVCRQVDGCIGARMTGGGFGGCVIALVHESEEKAFKDFVREHYEKVSNLTPEFYDTNIGQGVHQIY
ncbi:MAG: galactokinase [Bacteroidota bacterium]